MKPRIALSCIALLAASVVYAAPKMSVEEESRLYFQARNLIVGPTLLEDCWEGIRMLEKFQQEYYHRLRNTLDTETPT